ncbi:MAG: outer membrane protein assembly factor BamB [Thiotrichaceae bacterium]
MQPSLSSKITKGIAWSLCGIITFPVLSGCSLLPSQLATPFQQVSAETPKALNPLSAKNRVAPKLLWQSKLNTHHDEHIKVYPKIIGNAIVVAGQNSVSSWNKKTGKLQWNEFLGETITGGLNATKETVFVGTENGSALALDSKTGKTRWITLLKQPIVAISNVKEDKIVFRTLNGKIHTLSATNGEHLWQRTQQTPALSLQGASTPMLAGPFVITGFDNGSVVAYELDSGKEVWSAKLGLESSLTELSRLIDIDAEMTAIGTALFAVSYQGFIAGIDMRKGKVGWKRKLSSFTGIDANEKELFVSDNQGQIWKLDPLTGKPIWKNDDLLRRAPTAPVIVGSSLVVVGDSEGYLHLYNRKTGDIIGRIQGDRRGYTVTPVVQGNTIYTLGKSGLLSAYSM